MRLSRFWRAEGDVLTLIIIANCITGEYFSPNPPEGLSQFSLGARCGPAEFVTEAAA